MSNEYFKKSALRQPVPEAYLPTILLKWRLLPNKRCIGR
jgi:hypothetical protein